MKKTGTITVLISVLLFLGIGALQFAPILMGEAVFITPSTITERKRGEFHMEKVHVYLAEEDIEWDDKTRLLWAVAMHIEGKEEVTAYVSNVRRDYDDDSYVVHVRYDNGKEEDIALHEDNVEYD